MSTAYEDRGERINVLRSKQHEILELAEKWIYIRVGGVNYRPISIHEANPCGRLTKADGSGNIIGGTKNIENAFKNALKSSEANKYSPGNAKLEHRLQAGLIHYAIKNQFLINGRFNGFEDYFDKLIFITDELKIEDIRADIIALGSKDGKYFPVFIELKSVRTYTQVARQLTNVAYKAKKSEVYFVKMLARATGIEEHSILFDEYKLIAVWPSLDKYYPKKSTKKDNSILIGKYEKSNPFDSLIKRSTVY